jgi:hypothetical protein
MIKIRSFLTFYYNIFLSYIKSFFVYKSIATKINPKILKIDYIFQEKNYVIYLPIDNRLSSKMINYETFIIKQDGQKEKLNLQPGLTPHFTSKMLEVKEIITHNLITDKKEHYVTSEKIIFN